jgi:hypothetical protein
MLYCLQAGDHAGFKHLLALHAFVVTGVELCMPPKDPAKFLRSLAPYLKVAGGWALAGGRGVRHCHSIRACMHACYAGCSVGTPKPACPRMC